MAERRPPAPATDIGANAPLTFELFYQEQVERIAQALAVTLNDGDLAVDATNEAMTRAYQRWSKVGYYDNPAGWVYKVGLNWSLSWRRRRRRERVEPHATAAPTGADHVSLRDDSLDDALNSLAVDARAVVVCRIHLDWSVDQTAAALDIKPGTVKSRLSRALDQLRLTIDETKEARA